MRGLTLFRATRKAAPAGPPPAHMRGRAAEISDPSPFGWEVLWEALKTELPGDEASTLTQELGLDQEQEITSDYGGPSWYATEFSGTRHGRHVALRMGVIPGSEATATTRSMSRPRWRRFAFASPTADPPSKRKQPRRRAASWRAWRAAPEVWRKLEVDGGPDGILARRPVTAHPQGYLYDLWLIERIAVQLGA